MNKIYIPSEEEFIRGIEEFERREKRDAMYKVASFLISYFWGKLSDMADSLGVLLLTWNQAPMKVRWFWTHSWGVGKLQLLR